MISHGKKCGRLGANHDIVDEGDGVAGPARDSAVLVLSSAAVAIRLAGVLVSKWQNSRAG